MAGTSLKLPPASFLVLGVAALVLGGAIGIAVWRVQADAAPPPVTVQATEDTVITDLRRVVSSKPDDAAAWHSLGWSLFERGRFSDAADAYRRAVRITPESAMYQASLGEALVMAGSGEAMPPAALAAFQAAAKADPNDPRARYFLAMAQDLRGDHQGALDAWFALLADTPTGAPWAGDLRRTISQVAAKNGIDVAARLAGSQPVAPTPAGGGQEAMIAGMVASLEDKLAATPGDVDGWIMLMRSRMTLGESAKAAAALRAGVAKNPAAASRLRAEAKELAVPGA